ncbi:ABC transporter substrate-binding protein [Kaustia mangrovi]|uniref:ABC transporter substrate-binding protein n=1 Tax=Kaustia mangrovi TaxID=2593653 RepID=A0A7S8C7D5_9HYPH|nr:ABC transporter substrate-binding protein [Kaustia mangrovi]QPC44554.1 ABC transporter substrate-binding protein [Kaustia mangrovi]
MRYTRRFETSRRAVLAGGAAAIAAPFVSRLARAQDPVNVGVIVPLSGANAQFGINSRNGIQLVADEINAAGGIKSLGGAPINLVIADSTSTPTTAASVAQRMISQNQVVAVLGAFASSLTIAISEVTERRRLPLLTMSFSDIVTGRGFNYVFQVVNKGSTIGAAQFDYTMEIAKRVDVEADKVAILYEDTAYGTSQAEGLRKAATEHGAEIVMDSAYPLGITDVTPLINQLRGSGAQLVFPVSYLNDSLLIVRTMRQQGLTIPAIGGAAGYVIPDFHKGLGELSEGVLSIAPANYDLAPDYTERFRERFGYFMVHEALEHAAAMGVLREALEKSASRDPETIRNEIATGTHNEGWSTVMTGDGIRFDESGLNVNAFPVMVQWRGSELVTVHPADVARSEPVWSVETGQ